MVLLSATNLFFFRLTRCSDGAELTGPCYNLTVLYMSCQLHESHPPDGVRFLPLRSYTGHTSDALMRCTPDGIICSVYLRLTRVEQPRKDHVCVRKPTQNAKKTTEYHIHRYCLSATMNEDAACEEELVPHFEIKVTLLGHVSVGKTTVLNALFQDYYSEVSRRPTTAGVNLFSCFASFLVPTTTWRRPMEKRTTTTTKRKMR